MSILKYKDPKTGEFKRINPYKADLSFVGKDGITVNKATDSEKVEISGSGCVQKDTRNTGLRRAYTVNESGIEQIMMPINVDAIKTNIYSLVRRDGNVSVHGLVPDSPTDTVLLNKKYVDANYVKKVEFTNLEQALNGYILDTTEEAYADLDSAVLKDSVAVGDNVYPIADKTRALVSRIEGKTTKMVQLLDKSTFPATLTPSPGVTVTKTDDGGLHVSGTAASSGGRNSWGITVNIKKGHKYLNLLKGNNKLTTPFVTLKSDRTQYLTIADIATSTIEGECSYGFNLATEDYDETIYPNLFDLTAMNREDITTVEQFKAEFPELYPYENGNIYPAKISGVKFYENQDKSGEQASVTLPETYDLHGIGDYKDYLEITKNEDNELYTLKKVKQIEKRVLDGTETINKSGYITDNYQSYYISIALLHVNNGLGGICNKLPTANPNIDIEHITFGINNVYPYLFFNKKTYTTVDSVKEYLAAQYAAGDPMIIWYILQAPIETVIADDLTYEQVTAIRHNGGLIEVEGNVNKGYARPTVKNTIVYRLTATSTAEG